MAGEVNKGWISLYRSIQDHWLWQEKPFSKAQAWLDLLLSANHKEAKILMDNTLIKLEKGSFFTSELKLADRWGWSKKKVRNFLELLSNDNMIVKESTKKGTKITIVNYEVYQQRGNHEGTITEPQRNHEGTITEPLRNTNNNDNNDNNVNNDNNKTTTTICGSDEEFNIYKFLEKCNFILSPMLLEKIQADIEIYSLEEVKKAIEIADSNGKHSYSYVKGILERRRAGENKKITDRELFEKAAKEFLEDE